MIKTVGSQQANRCRQDDLPKKFGGFPDDNSLHLIRIGSDINKEFDMNVSISEFLQHLFLLHQANWLTELMENADIEEMECNKVLKRMNYLLVLVVFILLGGCSSTVPTVHLFSKYMTDEETQKVQTWFTEKGYVVETNGHEFPTGIYQSTLVFSPGMRSYNEVQPLVDAYRSDIGEPLGSRYFGSGKHRFSKDNIGLYIYGSKKPIIPEDYEVLMTVEYAAVSCDLYEFAYLNLRAENFELLIGNDTPERAEEHTHKGRWQQDENMLSLYKEEKLWAAMEMQHIEEMTEHGLRKGRALRPSFMQENIDNCLFEHTVVLK